MLKDLSAKLSTICGLNSNLASADPLELADDFGNGVNNLGQYLVYKSFDSDYQLFFNDGNSVGFLLEIAPIVGVDEAVYKNLQHFFNDELPDAAYLQFLLVASHEVDPILWHWQQARTSEHPVLNMLTEKRKSFIQEQALNFGVSDGRIARDYRIFVVFTTTVKSNQLDYSGILKFREQFIMKLQALQLAPIICVAEDLIWLARTLLYMELKPKTTPKYRAYELLSNQILEPASLLEVTAGALNHDNNLSSRIFYLKDLPDEFSLIQIINLLGDNYRASMGMPARFVISYVVSSEINQAMQQGYVVKGNNIINAAEKWYSRNDRDIKRKAQEWKDVIDRTKQGERLLSEHWQLMVTVPCHCLEQASQAALSLYNINNFKLGVLENLQFPGLLSLLPMQQAAMWKILKKFNLIRVALSQEVIERLPIHAEWKGVPKSGVLLHARRGQLFNFNPFYRISSGNYNVCVMAASGGGKSVFLQELAISQIAQKVKVFILDIGQSFANIASLLDGENIRFGKDVPFSLNPFASFNPDMALDDRDEFLRCTKSLLEVMCCVNDDPRGSADLEKCLVAALEATKYQLTITSFAKILERSHLPHLQQYGATLYPYTESGLYGKYFSGTKVASLKSMITVFEFEEIKNDRRLLAIVLQILLIEITTQFLLGDRETPFMIIVDEAWMLLDFAASFFAAFVRTVRKYGGSLVVCVQNFMDLQKTIDHKTILENSTWTILLKQDEKGLAAFRASEAFKNIVPLIKSITLSPNKFAEVLICATGITVVGRLVLDPYSSALYSTDHADVNFVKQQLNQGTALFDALDLLVKRKDVLGNSKAKHK